MDILSPASLTTRATMLGLSRYFIPYYTHIFILFDINPIIIMHITSLLFQRLRGIIDILLNNLTPSLPKH